jgi:hypothetical protein
VVFLGTAKGGFCFGEGATQKMGGFFVAARPGPNGRGAYHGQRKLIWLLEVVRVEVKLVGSRDIACAYHQWRHTEFDCPSEQSPGVVWEKVENHEARDKERHYQGGNHARLQ